MCEGEAHRFCFMLTLYLGIDSMANKNYRKKISKDFLSVPNYPSEILR